jgi:hypothetical protein
MTLSNIPSITPYHDINEVLYAILEGVVDIFGDNLVGLYLFGSLSYGDFHPDSSDIDLVAILQNPASPEQLALIKHLHEKVSAENEKWGNRLECSYTPIAMLQNTLPPEQPRPYFGEGVFYPAAHYGNEWIINLYLLVYHAIPLVGAAFKELLGTVPIVEVQKACIRDLFQEWQPKLTDLDWLNNSHYQSYLVLNLCRILYTVLYGATGSKTVSARWVKDEFPEWSDLIQTAEDWHYGLEMRRRDETIALIQFAIDKVTATPLYAQAYSEA